MATLPVALGEASGAGLVIDGVFHLVHAIPNHHSLRILAGEFPLGATLVLNVLAFLVLVAVWRLARRDVAGHVAIDPVCGMSVDPATAPASVTQGTETTYFCSLGCRDKYLARGLGSQPESRSTPIPSVG